ncbi:cytochrome P450 [Xylariaceae sp. FL0255]|nr:cytochrome P450 [Xylariaceae sp. FL0255]
MGMSTSDQILSPQLFEIPKQLSETSMMSIPVIVYLATALLAWRFYRFTITPFLHPSEPKELPYWIPFLGHLMEFFGNANSLLTRARNHFGNTREPFALTILGMRTYVLTKAEDVGEVYKNTESLSYEEFVQAMMRILGNSESCVKALFAPLPKDRNGSGFPNPRGKPLGILFRDMHIHQLFPGDNLDFLELRFHRFFDENLKDKKLAAVPYVTRDNTGALLLPLVQWCSDYFTQAGQDAYFGPELARIDPGLAENFITFDELSYQVIYQYPHFLAKEMRASRDRLLRAFKNYLELPLEQRAEAAWFVDASKVEMEALNLSSEDKAVAIMTIYWAINTNSRKAAYWLLAHLLQHPSLLDVVRQETAPMFSADGSVDITYLHKSVPRLDAMWAEMLRLSAFAASVRIITADTVIGGKTLRKGNRLIVPYRQLHMNEAVFGDDVEKFRHERFIEKPRLTQGNSFRPFGGGSTACPGRHIAKRAVLLFVTLVLHRYDIELVPGQDEMDADLTKPVPGLMSPKVGQDMMMRLKRRC